MTEERIKEMLKKVVLYQFGKYDKDKLDEELTDFLRESEDVICKHLSRNGVFCYRDFLEANNAIMYRLRSRYWRDRYFEEIKNIIVMPGLGWKLLYDMAEVSYELRYVDTMTLKEKILLFDKVIHLVHYGGESIFGVDITKIKEEVDKEVKEELGLL